MTLHQDLIHTASRILSRIPCPHVTALLLPPIQPGPFRDEFGFVLLDNGATGAFYVSLEDTLPRLWEQFPQPEAVQLPLTILLDKLLKPDLPSRALGLGAYNALSQHLMQLAGYTPAARQHKTTVSLTQPATIGMVGYFAPLVKRLTEQGHYIRVLELLPERVPAHPQVAFIGSPAQLAGCRHVICTASTLVNNTLDDILTACSETEYFALTGPSASGLPDSVFARGAQCVGAISFPDQQQVQQTLAAGQPWRKAGHKYEILQQDYPGLEALLDKIRPAV